MLHAIHCDGLVLGIGRSLERAYADAKAHGAELEGDDLQECRITLEAAVHVLAGRDCRGLKLHRNGNPERDRFALNGEVL